MLSSVLSKPDFCIINVMLWPVPWLFGSSVDIQQWASARYRWHALCLESYQHGPGFKCLWSENCCGIFIAQCCTSFVINFADRDDGLTVHFVVCDHCWH